MDKDFHGHEKKHLNHFLLGYERKILNACLPLVPSWMSTVHLTLMTIVWCIGIVFFSWLAVTDLIWLWGFSFCVFMQHVTDMLDGEIGRVRHEGLIKWGFYMDHVLDYAFVCAIMMGYSFLLPLHYSPLVLFVLAVIAGFMVHVFLDFGITHDFKISFNRLGPTEGRYLVIALNTAIMAWGRDFFIMAFPIIAVLLFIFWLKLIYDTQKKYFLMDKEELNRNG